MAGGLQNDHGRSVYFLLLFCIGFGLLGVIRSTHGDGRTEFILSGICLMVFIIITIIINIEDRQAKKKNKEKAEEEEKRDNRITKNSITKKRYGRTNCLCLSGTLLV